MVLEDFLGNDTGGLYLIEQEVGAEDGLSQAEKSLAGYKLYKAAPGTGVASVFEKAMPGYAKLFKIKTPPKILAAYFVTPDGMMISRYEREQSGLDADIFSSMLSAVDNFVKDSFQQQSGETKEENPKEGLNILQRGENTIQLSRGENGVLAVIYEGSVSDEIESDIDELNSRIHQKYNSELAKWNGKMNLPFIADIEDSMKNFLFDSKRYEGMFDIDGLRMAKTVVMENLRKAIEDESKNGKIAFIFDGVQNLDSLSAEMLEYVARNTNIPIICQYETGVLDEGIKNSQLNTVIEKLKTARRYQQALLKSSVNIEAVVTSKLAGIDAQAFEMLRYSAVAGGFDTGVISTAMEMPISAAEQIGKQLAEVGILKGSMFANSRLKERSLESIQKDNKMQIDIRVAYALMNQGAEKNSPKIAELLIPYVEKEAMYRELAVVFSIKAAEQFREATNLEAALDSYKTALELDKDAQRSIQTSKEILNLEWVTTRLDDMIEHANALEKLAEKSDDIRAKGFAVWSRGKAYSSKQNFAEALKEFNSAEEIFKKLNDRIWQSDILNSKGVMYKGSKEYDAAIKKYEEALVLSEPGSKQMGLILHNIGDSYFLKGDLTNAEKFIYESLKINQKIGNAVLYASDLAELAEIKYNKKDFENAIALGNESISISLKGGGFVYAIHAYATVGAALLDSNRHDESLQYLKKGIDLSQRVGHRKYLWSLYENLKELHEKESKHYAKLAEEINKK